MKKFMRKIGFEVLRQDGSEIMFKNSKGNFVMMPYHQKEGIKIGTLKSMIRQMNLTNEEFIELWREFT